MDLIDWKIIDSLEKYRNITKTAKMLYMSQPALTARIQKIEKNLDTPILIRHRRGIQFTSEGELLLSWAKKILEQHEELKDELNNMKNNFSGTLKIGVSKYFAKYYLPEILKMYKKVYSNIEFQVVTGWSGDIFKLITNREIHIGFIRRDYPWHGLRTLLFEEELCVFNTEPFEIEQLPKMPRIVYETDTKLNNIDDEWWAENFNDPPSISINVDQVDTCKEMILHGLGYGILPCRIMKNYSYLFGKTLKDKRGKSYKQKTWLYYHSDTLNINMVKSFTNFIEEMKWNEFI